ncbi:MAG TPA: beta-galactosidase GalA [Opitutaceae bacterium]|jgi:beta-galactosidase|nr:beta-galactosidase GalA [Opitutaceae bacterium]
MRTPLILLCVLAALCAPVRAADASSPRDRILLDAGWTFHLGDEWGGGQYRAKAGTGYGPAAPAFGDSSWRRVDLPHDWAVELPFDPHADVSHGFKAIGRGFPQNSVAWYRRRFDLPEADAGRRIWLEFGGVFRDCTVFVNGWTVGRHASGYNSFRYDVTDVVQCGGPNVVAVRVDASEPEGWFYEGAGIYRHVWLVKTAPVAIAPDGVFVSSELPAGGPNGPATVRLSTEILNRLPAGANAAVAWEIVSPQGRPVAEATGAVQVSAGETAAAQGALTVAQPQLWSPEHPALYQLVTTVTVAGRRVDGVRTEFGIRTVGFDPRRGFLLNGRPYALQGTCNHQDHAGVGTALPDALQYFRVAKLKEMGCNAYRTSHNPPTEELLEACDRLGMLVMDENRLLGSDAANLGLWREQLRRDRNHPSVAIWSIANEEFSVEDTPAGGRVAATMQALAHRIDPTRPVTYAAPEGDSFAGINGVIQVRGWNYHIGPDMDAYHAEHPAQPNVGTEQGSTVGTRGIYANDPAKGYVSAYDVNNLSWSNTAEQWLEYFRPRPWLSGGFVWTGFDYRGEPTPYAWPCINSHFGIMDTCGFPKDNYWYYQSCWTSQPVLHLLPHWTWPGREGRAIDVEAFSNCEEVELWLNGRSLGRRRLAAPGNVRWSVPYARGVLEAKAYRGGQLAAVAREATAGAPAAVRLTADRSALSADGRDAAVIAVAIVDDAGQVVPEADLPVRFSLSGPGRAIGVGNGDPSCHEPDTFVAAPQVRTIPVSDWRWHDADPYAANPPEAQPGFDDRTWAKWDPRAESGPLGIHEGAFARGRFELSAGELAAATAGVDLAFGKIQGDSTVFLNGRKLGPGGDSGYPVSFDATGLLHPGTNVIAVGLSSYGSPAGVNDGVAVLLAARPKPPAWSRSTFNGLAELVVQAGRTGGNISVVASAPGLASGRLEIETRTP